MADPGATPANSNGLASVAPPHDEEAEASVLGAIMLADRWFDTITVDVHLSPDDFYRPRNRAIFQAMLELNSDSEPIDTLTVSARLAETGKLEEAGGKDYIETLVTRIPAIGNTKQYAQIVKENSWLRGLIAATQLIQESVASREGEPRQLLKDARDRMVEVAADAQVDQVAKVAMTPATSGWSVPGTSTLRGRAVDETEERWRSITTAPRDGTYVLVFCEIWAERNGQYAQPAIACFDAEVGGWVSDDGDALVDEPTSWANLYAPPAEGEVAR